MDPTPSQADRGLWAFWIACVLAAAGAVAPSLLSGGSDRMNGSTIPFALAALAFAACAMLHHQGRPIATALYFVASLAVVYGVLALLALPLRLAVLGTCPGPGPCDLGLEHPITSAEMTTLGFVVGIGTVSVLTGFYGLRTLYRRHRVRRQTAEAPPTPPARRIPPVGTKSQADTTPAPSPVTSPAPVAVQSEGSAALTEAPVQPEPQAELPAHEPDLELRAHGTEKAPEAGQVAPAAAPQRQPKRQQKPKAPPEPPTSTNTE